jgi:hypothetical protein
MALDPQRLIGIMERPDPIYHVHKSDHFSPAPRPRPNASGYSKKCGTKRNRLLITSDRSSRIPIPHRHRETIHAPILA